MEEFEFKSNEIKKEPLDVNFDIEEITNPINTANFKFKCGEIFGTNIGDFHFFCSFCNENYINFDLLSTHIKSFHYPINFLDTTNKNLQNNIEIHSELQTIKLENLNADEEHTNFYSESFKCEKNTYPIEYSYKCEECPRVFIRANDLQSHMKMHNDVKSFNYKKTLPENSPHLSLLKEQSPTDYYECNICNRKFKHRSTHKKHQIIHTGKVRLKCDVCEKSFVDKTYLTHHKRTHTDEKKFICNICGKSFVIGSHLAVHSRIHSGEKPYSCSICEKSFGCTSSLARHKRIHNNDKPFDCLICKMSFRTKDNLIKHESSQRHEMNLVKIADALELNLVKSVTGFTNNDNGTISGFTNNDVGTISPIESTSIAAEHNSFVDK